MRALSVALVLFALASGASAQTPDANGVYDRAEIAPVPIGGMDAILSLVIYPPEAAAEGVEGRVFVQFIVTAYGDVLDARGARCPDERLCEAAVAAVQASAFTPGQVAGEVVATRVTLPVSFQLPEASLQDIAPLASGQTLSAPEADEVYESVDVPPELVGELAGLQRRVEYPADARRHGVQGTVYVQMVVGKNGQPRDIYIVHGIEREGFSQAKRQAADQMEAAALRAVEPAQFRPGIKDGRPVSVLLTIPIGFKLR